MGSGTRRLKAAQDAAKNLTAETVAKSMTDAEKMKLARVRNIGIAVRCSISKSFKMFKTVRLVWSRNLPY